MALGVALSLWVFATHVSGDFREVRIMLATAELSPQQRAVSLPLARAGDISDPYLVFIYRIRNNGTALVDL